MQNKSTILSFLVAGIVLILLAIFFTWQYGYENIYTVPFIVCIILGGICTTLSGIAYLRSPDKDDYFHLD